MYSLEVPRRGASNDTHNICFREEIRKYQHFSDEKSTLSVAMIHLYCLAVQACFYSDVVECWPVMQAARVRSPVAALVLRIFSPVTFVAQRTCK